MSPENVEVVRRFIEALPRAQASDDWQPVLAEVDPDVEIEDLDISLDTERYRGHGSVRKWIGDWMESWESWRLEDVQVRAVGEDRAIGVMGRASPYHSGSSSRIVFSVRFRWTDTVCRPRCCAEHLGMGRIQKHYERRFRVLLSRKETANSESELAALFASSQPFDLHYRLCEDRSGFGLQAEILRARAQGAAA